ncbi:MAG: substrate-binding domain-containing protein [Clostridiaceae bacterium]|nr:substrate-binding domain-containing protein [Clostridiaceae bacterium]
MNDKATNFKGRFIYFFMFMVLIPAIIGIISFFILKNFEGLIPYLVIFIVYEILSAFILSFIKTSGYKEESVIQLLEENITNCDFSSNEKEKNLPEKIKNFRKKMNEFLGNVHMVQSAMQNILYALEQTTSQFSSSVSKITLSADAVAKGAEQQAKDTEACSDAMQELSERINSVSQSMEEIGKEFMITHQKSEEGTQNIARLIEESTQSLSIISDTNNRIEKLNQKAKEIEKVLSVIADISNQTSLLSLNASIEAAHAGAYGRGFAVVAQEIRKLAEQSRISGIEINKIVSGIKSEIEATNEIIRSTGEVLKQQVDALHMSQDIFRQIADSVRVLFGKMEKVVDSVQIMDEQKNNVLFAMSNIAAVAGESAASSQEMASLTIEADTFSGTLREIWENLKKNNNILGSDIGLFKFDSKVIQNKKFLLITSLPENHPFFIDTVRNARIAAKKYNWDIVEAYVTEYDAGHQAALVEKVMAENKLDGIVISPIDDAILSPVLRKAGQLGIKVVCFDGDAPSSGRISFIGTDDRLAGRQAAEIVAKLLNKKGNVILSTFDSSQDKQALRIEGIKEVLSRYPDIKILAIEDKGGIEERRTGSIERIVKEYPNFDLMLGLDADFGPRAAKVWKKYNLDKKFVAWDRTEENMQYLREGIITAIIAQRQQIWGELGVKVLNDAVNGKPVKQFYDTGVYEINRQNLSIFGS